MYPVYVSYAQRFVRDRSQAGDIAQQAFIKMWEGRNALDPDGSVRSYMYTMVRNLSLNHIRDHQNRFTNLSDDALTIHHQPEIRDEEIESPEDVIKKLVEVLPDRQKEAFLLSRVDGLQHEEIAEIMEISSRTVNNHLVAALKSLRTAYDDYRKQQLAL